MRKPPLTARSKSYEVGYRRPPKKHQFQPGRSGNPTGVNRKAETKTATDLRASLEQELGKKIKIKRGNGEQVTTQAEAGISELVRQYVEGNARARRDLLLLAERVDVELAPAKTVESALDQALSAEDEAILADFVKRHGGQYPLDGNPAEDASRLASGNSDIKLLSAPSENVTRPKIGQNEESSDE